jgi:hypothetical protein
MGMVYNPIGLLGASTADQRVGGVLHVYDLNPMHQKDWFMEQQPMKTIQPRAKYGHSLA